MIFEQTDDQTAILNALERLLRPYQTLTPELMERRETWSPQLQRDLAEGGFLDVGVADADSAVAAALVVGEAAKTAVAVEVSASSLVRPALDLEIDGPLAVVTNFRKPARFLPQAKAALILTGDDARLLTLSEGDVTEAASIFSYPLGRLATSAEAKAVSLGADAAGAARTWLRVGLAMEVYGALDSALKLIVDHVTNRRQFGRPLGSFQALQHRLAMDASRIEGCRWLAIKAAWSGDAADAALAAAYAQESIEIVAYDLHQFTGAMGFTLEYPLRLYTYRAKLLLSELGGSGAQFADAADLLWPEESAA